MAELYVSCPGCRGLGWRERQLDVDRFDHAVCDECDGSGGATVEAKWVCPHCREHGNSAMPDECPGCGESVEVVE